MLSEKSLRAVLDGLSTGKPLDPGQARPLIARAQKSYPERSPTDAVRQWLTDLVLTQMEGLSGGIAPPQPLPDPNLIGRHIVAYRRWWLLYHTCLRDERLSQERAMALLEERDWALQSGRNERQLPKAKTLQRQWAPTRLRTVRLNLEEARRSLLDLVNEELHYQRPVSTRRILLLFSALAIGASALLAGYMLSDAREERRSAFTIAVGEFTGPSPQEYRVTEYVLDALRHAPASGHLNVIALGEAIVEDSGPAVAISAGERHNADMVVWGWYGATGESVAVRIHVEVLQASPSVQALASTVMPEVPSIAPIQALARYELQGELAAETAYLVQLVAGAARLESGAFEEAISILEMAEQSEPEAQRGLAKFYRGLAEWLDGDPHEALAVYNDLAQAGLLSEEGRLNRAGLLAINGELEMARMEYEAVHASYPVNALVGKAAVEAMGGAYTESLISNATALAIEVDDWRIIGNHGHTLWEMGRFDEALSHYNHAIELAAKQAPLENADRASLASIYVWRGNLLEDASTGTPPWARMLEDYGRAMELQPSTCKGLVNAIRAALPLDRVEDAIEWADLVRDRDCEKDAFGDFVDYWSGLTVHPRWHAYAKAQKE